MQKKKNKKDNVVLRALTLGFAAFFLSVFLSATFEGLSRGVALIWGIPLFLLVVALGVLTDGLGVASARAKPEILNAMASRKVFGAKEALWYSKNAPKVSSFLNDLVGDVAATISGALAVAITMAAVKPYQILHPLFLSSLGVGAASFLTVGGKALFKNYSLNHSESIVLFMGKARWVWLKVLGKGRVKSR